MQGGFQAGITSPSRPWFRLKTHNTILMDSPDVSIWLHEVETLMREVFAQSNTYNSLLAMYLELGVFGTAAVGIYEDYENVIRLETFTIGQYRIGRNAKGEIDTFVHDYQLTVNELVKEFGKESVSPKVMNAWKAGRTDELISIRHIVEPNNDRNSVSPLAKHKKFRSLYYEKTSKNKLLRESGFDSFPYICPRWEVVGQDTYATNCPGMASLDYAMALQVDENKLALSTEHSSDPAYQIPSSLVAQLPDGSLHPGTQIPVDDMGYGAKAIFDGTFFRTDGLEKSIDRKERQISEMFFENLFLMLINSDRTQITATEINAKNSEKIMAIGPVLERLNQEALTPLIRRTFEIMSKAGILPEPPEELQNEEVKVDYISVLAQAQKLTQLSEIQQFSAYVAQMSELNPEALMKFDIKEAIDSYGEALGIEPKLIRSNEDVQALIEQQQQAQQAQQMQEQAAQMAQTAKTISEVDTSGDNAMNRLLSGTLGG